MRSFPFTFVGSPREPFIFFFKMASERKDATGHSPTGPTLSNAEKWDHSVENGIRKATQGFVSGLIPALFFARSLTARCSILMLATGVGLGIAYGEATYLFERDVTFERRHSIQSLLESVVVSPPPTKERRV